MFVIRHIVGRVLQVYDPADSNMTDAGPKEVLEFDISTEAKIVLNGVPVKIAELQPYDLVNIDNPSKEGFRAVEVTRDRPYTGPGAVSDLSSPRVLRLEYPEGTQENNEFGNRVQPRMSSPGKPPADEESTQRDATARPKSTTKAEQWLRDHKTGRPEEEPKLVTDAPKSPTEELPERTAQSLARADDVSVEETERVETGDGEEGDGTDTDNDNVSSMPGDGSEEGEPTSAKDVKSDASSTKVTQPHKPGTRHTDAKRGRRDHK